MASRRTTYVELFDEKWYHDLVRVMEVDAPHITAPAKGAAFVTEALAKVLREHATAITRAGEASDRHARSLTRATWALVAATIILALLSVAGRSG